eukprot:scaffold2045_cov404-Prasinococcus_capsulatus_cf.AAC.56
MIEEGVVTCLHRLQMLQHIPSLAQTCVGRGVEKRRPTPTANCMPCVYLVGFPIANPVPLTRSLFSNQYWPARWATKGSRHDEDLRRFAAACASRTRGGVKRLAGPAHGHSTTVLGPQRPGVAAPFGGGSAAGPVARTLATHRQA